jgi:tetratricopeptide (TPR) repeat protein
MRNSAVACVAFSVLALACRSQPFGAVERANARAHLDLAEADVRAGAYARALERLSKVHALEGLEPDLRARGERLIDEAARNRFAELEAAPEELQELFLSELPARVRARAGLLAAERMLAAGERISAVRQVRKVDETLPGHPERVLAGDVLARSGLGLIHDTRRYGFLFRYRERGVQALEYLVVHYPLEARCAEALYALSETYERKGDHDLAIERTESLLLYHPASPYAVAAAARLPYLRLCRLTRDDYSRAELLRARAELVAWRERNPGHELSGWVDELHQECLARLVRNDLYLARLYQRRGTPAGVRLHAERARTLAFEVGLAAEEESARRLLAQLPLTHEPTPSAVQR